MIRRLAILIVTEAVQELLDACSCCVELKNAAQAYLDAEGTAAESEAYANLKKVPGSAIVFR